MRFFILSSLYLRALAAQDGSVARLWQTQSQTQVQFSVVDLQVRDGSLSERRWAGR